MIGPILRRELLDHLMSVRFALTLLITVALMVVNGVLFSGIGHQVRMAEYHDRLESSASWVEQYAGSLGDLTVRGPGYLVKRPSSLSFIASGRESFLPPSIEARALRSWGGSWGFTLYMPWYLTYRAPQAPPSTGIVPDFVEVDWVFIVGFCMSLMALLLTYDGVCGERREGTLKLLLSGPVPRYTVLLGKLAAAWAVVSAALTVGVVVNLVILSLFGPIRIDADVWLRLLPILAACLLYLGCFVGLGLLASTLSERPSSCLVSLLLVWTVLLVLLPNTVAGVVSYFQKPEADGKAHQARREALTETHLKSKFQVTSRRYGTTSPVTPVDENERPPYEFLVPFSDFLAQRLQLDVAFEEDRLRRQLAPVELGMSLSRISPYGTFQYTMESLAGTGLPRHQRFLDAARRYETTFRRFTDERDAADAGSYHLFGLAPGLSSEPVPVEAIPRFHEDRSLNAVLDDTAADLALLALFVLAIFMAANAAFLRTDVA